MTTEGRLRANRITVNYSYYFIFFLPVSELSRSAGSMGACQRRTILPRDTSVGVSGSRDKEEERKDGPSMNRLAVVEVLSGPIMSSSSPPRRRLRGLAFLLLQAIPILMILDERDSYRSARIPWLIRQAASRLPDDVQGPRGERRTRACHDDDNRFGSGLMGTKCHLVTLLICMPVFAEKRLIMLCNLCDSLLVA